MQIVFATVTSTLVDQNPTNMSLKKITIVYLPGYAGNFLEALFSLDSTTVPLWKIDNDTPMDRVNSYLNVRQNKKILHMHDLESKKTPDNLTDYQYIFNCTHPAGFNFQNCPTQVLLVDLDWSDFSNYWLMESKKSFDYQLARLRADETRQNLQVKKHFNTKIIDLNQFLDRRKWQKEYEKINLLLGLPNHYAAADKLYSFWYDLRVQEFVTQFDQLSPEQYSQYCHQRLKEEERGTPGTWQIFYQRVKDPQWPDCEQEQDFFQLPDWIQQELITKFGYQPQKQA
jgi:hypothetical protein